MSEQAAIAAGDELVIGVLGGMGPQASADFLAKLVAATPVQREQDHLRVLLDSNPKVPDRNRAIAAGATGDNGASATDGPGPVLAAMARGLEQAGANLLVMACNTAHAFEADIRAAISVPFVSMIEEACDACARGLPGLRRVGVLAAQGCLDAGLYQRALARRGYEALLLAAPQQAHFMQLLYRIKLGDLSSELRAEMRTLAMNLIDAGADALVAGCTEVPLVLDPADLPQPLVDATANLAQRCVRYARRLEALPADALR
ncbi:aspartate/glutamate racemase family protein [Paraburkholderia sp. ZP32-5]|uniref:aspartate/glutamate racemase family protein n=1 Tax=Paraburkholderia sp. ZP32-5 TaxID=2883245 RepID=UPI001F2A0D3E|nr:amino acid racemase [Paraburkholderia sp. ZP32-5]